MSDIATRTLGDLVAEAPRRAAVLDAGAVAADLDQPDVTVDRGDHPSDPSALADHIEATHHAYLHAELPALDALAEKVAGVHGARHPELADVRRLVTEIRADLEPHLMKEERVLFPAIRALEGGAREFPFGSVRNPIRMMRLEHDQAGGLLVELRAVSDGYVVPEDGCASYRALYERLAALEADTHLHIHLENNVLFPVAAALEDS
jgi:regulator of cell morphogenesis and NO signaling